MRALAIAAASVALLGAARVEAQIVGIKPTAAELEHDYPWINRADCLAGTVASISVTITPGLAARFEAWVGQSCEIKENRNPADPTRCFQIATPDTDPTNQKVLVPFRDLVADAAGAGSAACDRGEEFDTTVYFGLLDSTSTTWLADTRWTVNVDTEAPAAPSEVSAGIGENSLELSWTPPEGEDDIDEYRFYCVPIDTTTSQPLGGQPGGDAGDAAGETGGDGAAATDAGSDGDGTGGTGGSAATDAADDAAAEVSVNAACPTDLLRLGEPPGASLDAYVCGTASGTATSSGQASDLVNGTLYAVAVASVDLAGNVGPLSEVVCGTPQVVDDFFEIYRDAGGKGGGGFCSASGRAEGAAGALLVAAGAWLARRRRRG